MLRRKFLGACAGAAALTAAPQAAADAEVEVRLGELGATISPHIYGHFIEHLGGVIYDGIWVGRDSKIESVSGIRKRFVDEMKRIAAPNLRWPGGCFADGYHWRDGIGKPDKRKRTYNYWEPQMPPGVHATETNQFGTHEFMQLCRLVGAAPYLAGNVGSGTVEEFHDWVQYCNAPVGTVSLADERAANGDAEPFHVKYWGVGNESWGCGGIMKPDEYVPLFYRFTAQVPAYETPYLVAVGPRGHDPSTDLNWTTGIFEALRGRRPPDGFSMHFYTDFRKPEYKAFEFPAKDWYSVLQEGARIEPVLLSHWDAMGRYDKAHRTKFVVDEWGAWYGIRTSELGPAYLLSQTGSLRDALLAAMTFDIFNRHADKVAMANIAQTINCIHSLFWARGDQFVRTPTYHVFDLYKPHMGGRLAAMQIKAPEFDAPTKTGSAKMAALTGSASVTSQRLTITVTNPSLENAVQTRIRIEGARLQEARGRVLTHNDMEAANTFAEPEKVMTSEFAVSQRGEEITLKVPPKAVVAIEARVS